LDPIHKEFEEVKVESYVAHMYSSQLTCGPNSKNWSCALNNEQPPIAPKYHEKPQNWLESIYRRSCPKLFEFRGKQSELPVASARETDTHSLSGK
jgi:hypothetical protein